MRRTIDSVKSKDRAKFATRKEAKSKGKSKALADDDDSALEAPKKWRDYNVEFHFPEPTELMPLLLQLIDVGFGYPDRPNFALKSIDVDVDMGTQVAIAGPNGAGISTLLISSTHRKRVVTEPDASSGSIVSAFCRFIDYGQDSNSVSSTDLSRSRGSE